MNNTAPLEERLRLEGGLGPLQAIETPLELEIRPMTIFIGPQGSGKSLVSQLIYFFRDAQYLLARYAGQQQPAGAIRRVVEGIRTGDLGQRNLASFLTTPQVKIQYQVTRPKPLERSLTVHQKSRKITPLSPFSAEVSAWLKAWQADPVDAGQISPQALFVPAERTFFSRFINSDPNLLGHKALPLTMREFARLLLEAADLGQLPAHRLMSQVYQALGGQVVTQLKPYAREWRWQPQESSQPIELEMASSGQMEAWPLVFITQAMVNQPEAEWPRYWHIEEPETHLHPSAQVAIMHLLAYLANRGCRLIITTHSLVVAYTLNNLTLAYRQLADQRVEGMPDPETRLDPANVAAYLFNQNWVTSVIDETGQMDEGLLGQGLGDLQIEFNHLMSYKILWG